MIRGLRGRHRRMIVLLAIALPLLVAAGLLARRPIPRMERLPDGLVGAADDSTASGTPRIASWDGGSLRASLAGGIDGAAPVVSIELLQELERPELLVYWIGGTETVSGAVPANAELLGRLAGRNPIEFELPNRASDGGGRLILYSPAQDEVVTSFQLSTLPVSAGGGSG